MLVDDMARLPRGFLRVVLLGCFIMVFLGFLTMLSDDFERRHVRNRAETAQRLLQDEAQTSSSTPHVDLSEQQCRATFPQLFTDINESVARGTFTLQRSSADYKGLVQGRIKDGKVRFQVSSFRQLF